MANKLTPILINQIGEATIIDDDSLFVMEQDGTAYSIRGAVLKQYIADRFATEYANLDAAIKAAANSATESKNQADKATQAADDAILKTNQTYTAALKQAELATQAAQAAQDAANRAQAEVNGLFYMGDDGYVYQRMGGGT